MDKLSLTQSTLRGQLPFAASLYWGQGPVTWKKREWFGRLYVTRKPWLECCDCHSRFRLSLCLTPSTL